VNRDSERTRRSPRASRFSRTYFRSQADEDFNTVKAKALVGQIISFLKNEDNSLLAFEEVRSLLKAVAEESKAPQLVPLSLIVGSEGRYRDFTRGFLPKSRALRERWTRVDEAFARGYSLPPVELYKLGGVYFVRDGNHRVSVAKSRGLPYIEANVTALSSAITIDAGMDLQQIKKAVLQFERQCFETATGMVTTREDYAVDFTETGRYDDIVTHVKSLSLLAIDSPKTDRADQVESLKDATLNWYETVYKPIVGIVREERLLECFPERTEADMYIWLVRHWEELKHKYGETYPIRSAARDLKRKPNGGIWKRYLRLLHRMLRRMVKAFRGKGRR
jgi:hypothetical protein